MFSDLSKLEEEKL